MKNDLTQSQLKEHLCYDPDTGVFTRLVATTNCIQVGEAAGCHDGEGYRLINVRGYLYKAHRLAWLYVNGVWPEGMVDHENGVRDDNRLCNLRLATPGESQRNRGTPKHNTSGYKGVSWHKWSQRWRAQIGSNGRSIDLGRFDTPEEARQAYEAAATARFGAFKRQAA